MPDGRERETDEWARWANHVLSELRRLDEDAVRLRDEMSRLVTRVAVLEARASLWGAIAGFVAAGLLTIVLKYLGKG